MQLKGPYRSKLLNRLKKYLGIFRQPLSRKIKNLIVWTSLYTLLHWFIWPIGAYISHRDSRNYSTWNYRPRVAVLIPCRNKEDTIYEVLVSIINQSYRPTRIMVTDDYSTDNSLDEILMFAKGYFSHLKCKAVSDYEEVCTARRNGIDFVLVRHTKTNLGKSRSINKMVSMLDEKSFDLVAIIDADTKLHRDWIKNSIRYHSDPNVAATYGWVQLWGNKTYGYLKRVRDFEYKYLLPLLRKFMNPRSHWTMAGSNILYKLSILKKYPVPEHMNENASEDLIHTIMLQSLGYKVIFVPEAIAYSKEELDFTGIIKQSTRWFKGTWYALLEVLLPNKELMKRLTNLHKLQVGAFFIMPYYLLLINLSIIATAIIQNPLCLVWPAIDYSIFLCLALITYKYYKRYMSRASIKDLLGSYPYFYFMRNYMLIPYFAGLREYLKYRSKTRAGKT